MVDKSQPEEHEGFGQGMRGPLRWLKKKRQVPKSIACSVQRELWSFLDPMTQPVTPVKRKQPICLLPD